MKILTLLLLLGVVALVLVIGTEGKIKRKKSARELQQQQQDLKNGKNEPVCDNAFGDAIGYFATKTPYLPHTVESITPPGCTAEQFWYLGRHGTRYPGDDDILEMKVTLPMLRNLIRNSANESLLCPNDLEGILNWMPNSKLNTSQESWLVDQGYTELREISNRFQQRFPKLFPPTFNSESYYFRGTKEQRAQESAKAFAGAIFGQSLPDVTIAPPINGDPILHFYKTCAKWILQVDNNPEAAAEHRKFVQSPVFLQTLETVRQRLGLSGSMTEAELLLMYKTCNFETAWNPDKLSPWCAVFTQEEFEVLEYQEDLEDYWMDGYAYPITYKQACTPVKDVVEQFSAKILGSKRLTTAYFGHSGTILKVYARLGLFKDDGNLTSDGFTQFTHSTRQWLNSRIGKFASNLAFVLFNCDDSTSTDPTASKGEPIYKIGTLVQEQPIALPACGGSWICPFSEFKQNMASIVNTCNLEEICKVDA